MKLQPSYDTMSDVPAGFESAFTEQDGKAVFAGGEFEFKSEAEYNEVLKAKQAGFDQLHEMKSKLKGFDGIDPAAYRTMQEQMEVLRAKAKDGASDEETIKAIVDQRVARLTEELTTENKSLSEKLGELEGYKLKTEKDTLLNGLLGQNVSETALDDARFIIGSAIERQADGTYVSNGQAGFEKGLPVDKLLSKAMETRTHWKKQSTPGHGANGARGAGSVSKASRFNELLQKSDKLSRSEASELEAIASEIKTEQKGA